MRLHEEDSMGDLGDRAYAQELLQIQTWYNQEKKRIDDMLAKKRSEAVVKYQGRAIQKGTKTVQPPQPAQKQTGQVDTAGNPVTPQGGTPTVESVSILRVKKLNEVIYDVNQIDPEELGSLKDYLDAENISYIENESDNTIEFDNADVDDEWLEQLPTPENDDILSIEDEDNDKENNDEEDNDEEDIVDKSEQIDQEKVFYVKVDDENEEFVGKIYKLFDEGEWRSKLVDGESKTFEKLNYDPDWDEIDIIAFLRENYADAELIDKSEFNNHIEESTKLIPNLGGKIDPKTHKMLKRGENKNDNELTNFEKEITETFSIPTLEKFMNESNVATHVPNDLVVKPRYKKGDFIYYKIWFKASPMVRNSKTELSSSVYCGRIDKVTKDWAGIVEYVIQWEKIPHNNVIGAEK